MTKDELITFALEARLFDDDQEPYLEHLAHFAKLVAEAEREQCAIESESHHSVTEWPEKIAAAIRARKDV